MSQDNIALLIVCVFFIVFLVVIIIATHFLD